MLLPLQPPGKMQGAGLEMALVCGFCVPCQRFLQYTGWQFNPAKKCMLCRYTCTSGEGSWPKTDVEDETEIQNKPEKRRGGRGRTGTRRERAGDGTCAQLQRQREKQGRGTTVGRVMGLVRYGGGRREESGQEVGKLEASGE